MDGLAELSRLGVSTERSEAPILRLEKVAMPAVHRLCALMWSFPTLVLDLTDAEMEPAGTASLFCALRSTVTSLKLAGANFTLKGGSLDGVEMLCSALHDGSCAAAELDLSRLGLGANAGALTWNGLADISLVN